jgi:4-hydroxy-tetrahydrodipicolinate synthase
MFNKLKGIGCDLVTPFHKDGNIDFQSLENLVEHLIKNKIDYLVILGNTGESCTLTKDEKLAVMNSVVDVVNKRVPVIAGVGGNNTQKIVNLKDNFIEGIDAILSVCPYFSKPSQRGIYIHFKTIANVSPYPIIIHNSPAYTGVNIEPDTLFKIAEETENVIGIKESSSNICQCINIIKNKPKNFAFISGNDYMTLPYLALGAEGAISVLANAYPRECYEIVHNCIDGDFKKANKIYYQLLDILNSINEDGQPSGIKALLESLELCQNNLRLPHVKVNKNVYNSIKENSDIYDKSFKKSIKITKN